MTAEVVPGLATLYAGRARLIEDGARHEAWLLGALIDRAERLLDLLPWDASAEVGEWALAGLLAGYAEAVEWSVHLVASVGSGK